MAEVTLYEHINFVGRTYDVNTDMDSFPDWPGTNDGQTSSIKVFRKGWVRFWEGTDWDDSNDQLWVEGPMTNNPNLQNLHTLPRPHGNNHWGDRIRCISFPGQAPDLGDANQDNRTVVFANGRIVVGKDFQPNRERSFDREVPSEAEESAR
jgi:hypothetical protein